MPAKQKTRIGHVVSNKMEKTAVVAVETAMHHPLYKKTIKRMIKYKAHDASNECSEGDLVRITETRPLSKDKRWRVTEIIKKKEAIEIKPEEITEPRLGDA